MFVVVDLDGTLCDDTHKEPLLIRPKNLGDPWPEQCWDAWLAACRYDQIIQPVAEVVRALIATGHRIEFWTGRGENARGATRRWLRKHGFKGFPLRMRDMDHGATPDHIWKASYVSKFGRPDLVLEDRPSVVAMWRSMGIQCFQVAEGT